MRKIALALLLAVGCSSPPPPAWREMAGTVVRVDRANGETIGGAVVVYQNSKLALLVTASHVLADEKDLILHLIGPEMNEIRIPFTTVIADDHDLTILKTDPIWPYVADWSCDPAPPFRIVTVGYPLGHGPMLTDGWLSTSISFDRHLVSAATYYGNSGGGVFFADPEGRWHLYSIQQQVFHDRRGVVIPSLGLCAQHKYVLQMIELGVAVSEVP